MQIVKIKAITKIIAKDRYDLTVSTTSNFFANDILIHNSNASIYIDGDTVIAGSRNQWLIDCPDNFGFRGWVEQHKEQLKSLLGDGLFYGEWVGQGINNGEGLIDKKVFAMFNVHHFRQLDPAKLFDSITHVPVLYEGKLDWSQIEIAKNLLLEKGSQFIEGFMRPEGLVIYVDGKLLKYVFDETETNWTQAPRKDSPSKPAEEIPAWLTTARLENVLSKDGNLTSNFPKSLPDIAKLYIADVLEEEGVEVSKTQTSLVFKLIKNHQQQ